MCAFRCCADLCLPTCFFNMFIAYNMNIYIHMLLLLQKWQQSSFEQLQLFEGTRALQTGQSTWECQPINNIEVTISVLTVSINW